VQASYTYDPYGNLLGKTGTVTNRFGYAGQYSDSESGLTYLRARYYDPGTAQFLNKDPLGGISQLPVTLNLYTYAANNPLKFVDPTGLYALPYGEAPPASVPWWFCLNHTCHEYDGNWFPTEELTPEEELQQEMAEAEADNVGGPDEGNWAQVVISLLNFAEMIVPPSTCYGANPQWPPLPPSTPSMPEGPSIAPAQLPPPMP
jgi:RHS repeat-associated protein